MEAVQMAEAWSIVTAHGGCWEWHWYDSASHRLNGLAMLASVPIYHERALLPRTLRGKIALSGDLRFGPFGCVWTFAVANRTFAAH